MLSTFCLLGCALVPSQGLPPVATPRPAPAAPSGATALKSGEWVMVPRLQRNQELVYRGTYAEEAVGSRVQFNRAYRVESRLFVVDVLPRETEYAVQTVAVVRRPEAGKGAAAEPAAGAVRLERVRVDNQGKVGTLPDVSVALALDGPPTLEVGCFVEVPKGKLVVNQGWETTEPGRPVTAWRIAGHESACGQACVKLVGVQSSDDWDRPRADRGAWRRTDTVWVSPRNGVTQKVERTVEHRDPARREVSLTGTLRYELESSLVLPAGLAADRRAEVTQALALRKTASAMVGEPAKFPRQLASLAKKIGTHIDTQPPTPFREAVLLVKRHVDAAVKGEAVVRHADKPAAAESSPGVAAVGRPAPDFTASCMTEAAAGRLSRWKGKPAVFVFYNPASPTAAELLAFAQGVHATFGRNAAVVGMSVSDDKKAVLEQRDALKLGFPILNGGGLRISYAVEATPQVVVIDGAGVVRGMYSGWGRETPAEVLSELKRWLHK